MTRHLLRLIWNRKRQNFLLTVEIFCSFLVLFGVVMLSVHYFNNWLQPLGFDVERVWSINVGRNEPDSDPAIRMRHRQTFQQLLAALADLPEIEVAAGAQPSIPYSSASWGTDENLADGRTVGFGANQATDRFAEVLRMEMVAGRWFSREDDGVAWRPVVINEKLAREIFGDVNPIGRDIPSKPPSGDHITSDNPAGAKRVVGVFRDFRQMGEFAPRGNFLMYRLRLDQDRLKDTSDLSTLPNVLIVRVRPGTTAAFEETLVRRLGDVARGWTFTVRPLTDMRADMIQAFWTPLVAVSTIAGFLLLMVALGLTGVVWQAVTQRTREFGLRRAKGATIPNVRRQVLTELVIMTSLALAAGVILVAQLPLLQIADKELAVIFDPVVFVTSVALSVAAIYGLTLACGWYPSRLATAVPPAEALHYE